MFSGMVTQFSGNPKLCLNEIPYYFFLLGLRQTIMEKYPTKTLLSQSRWTPPRGKFRGVILQQKNLRFLIFSPSQVISKNLTRDFKKDNQLTRAIRALQTLKCIYLLKFFSRPSPKAGHELQTVLNRMMREDEG